MQNSTNIFISYSHKDRFAAETIAKNLSEIGFRPWIDFTGIVGGTEWKQSIESALGQAAIFLVLLTPDAVGSEWVRYEITQAQQIQLPIIPLLIRSCDLPSELTMLQYVDFRQGNEAGFKHLQIALMNAIITRQATSTGQVRSGADQEVKSPVDHDTATSGIAALVVEDVAYYRDFLREILSEMGFNVHVAATRNEATRLMREHRYDLISLDMQLGPDDELARNELGQDGLYLLSLLKRYQHNVPVIIVSSLEWDEQDQRIMSKEQVKGVLRKPLDEHAHNKLWELVKTNVAGMDDKR